MRKKKNAIIRVLAFFMVGILVLTMLTSCSIALDTGSGKTDEATKNKEIENHLANSKLQYPAKNDLFFYNVYKDYVKITKYIGEGGEVTVPSTIENLPVYEIGKDAFKETSVTKVTIEKGVYKIAASCFEKCAFLENIDLPDSLVGIGQYAFRECSTLKEITIPRQVGVVPAYICLNCESLETVTILNEKANGQISTAAFSGCVSLKTVYVPKTIATISADAFSNISEEVVFYGPAECAAAKYCADYFLDYIVDDGKEENRPVENVDNEDTNSEAAGEKVNENSNEKNNEGGTTWMLIGVGVLFIGIIVGGIVFFIMRRRR